MKTNLIRYTLVTFLGVILLVFTQCMPTQVAPYNHQETAAPINIPTDGLLPQDVDAPDVGVKDFERIYHTMSALTGVSIGSNNVRSRYEAGLKNQLPTNSRIESYQESQMLAVTKLATDFCDTLIANPNNSTLRESIWPSSIYNFGNGNLFNNAQTRGNFIVALLEAFWGQDILDEDEYQEGFVYVEELMLDARESGSSTTNTAKLACTAVLSSAQVIIQ
jgi:hypothetical protein